MSRATPGCGAEGPHGYRCTHHKNGQHEARGTERGSLAEAWPIESRKRTTPNINRILRAHPRDGKYGAPMGAHNYDDRLSGSTARVYCQRVRFIDGDYGPDGTYWGGGMGTLPLYCVFSLAPHWDGPYVGQRTQGDVFTLRHYVRAATRAEALKQFHQE